MSYSRWGGRGSGHWYTFWCAINKEKENRDNAIFEVCAVIQLSAKELRDNMEAALQKVAAVDSYATKKLLDELKIYMNEFLLDIDEEYAEEQK